MGILELWKESDKWTIVLTRSRVMATLIAYSRDCIARGIPASDWVGTVRNGGARLWVSDDEGVNVGATYASHRNTHFTPPIVSAIVMKSKIETLDELSGGGLARARIFSCWDTSESWRGKGGLSFNVDIGNQDFERSVYVQFLSDLLNTRDSSGESLLRRVVPLLAGGEADRLLLTLKRTYGEQVQASNGVDSDIIGMCLPLVRS